VARLLERTPADGLGLPLAVGGTQLSEVELGTVTSIAPFAERAEEVAARLGGSLPTPGQVVAVDGGRLLWAGPGRALLVGPEVPDLRGLAAVVDQGDGIAAVRLDGEGARDVLARLVPLDLREGAFPDGATARTLLGHMTVTLTRVGADSYEVMGMRSMAATLVRELVEAMRHVAARG
jgi:sarcosine oxidase subunit gamma